MEVKLFEDKLRLDNEPPSVPSGPTLLSTSKATLISHTLSCFTGRFHEQSFIGEVLLETLHAMNHEMCKIYVFGSFSLNCLVKLNPEPNDIDLLIVGENVFHMANAFATFISQFGEATHMIKPGLMQIILKDSESHRSFKIQVVLRHYKSLTEAASEIDFPVTAVFFDGTNIFFNEETRRQLVAHRIEVVPKRFSYSSVSRLLKYQTRGFSITFPGLHINAFQTGNPVRLFNGVLHINYFKVHGLLVYGTMDLVNYKKANYDDDLPTVVNAPFFNAVNLGSKLILCSIPGEECIDLSKIKNFEDAVPKKQFDIQKMNVVHEVCKVDNGDLTVNISVLKKFLDVHDTLHFVQMYMERDIQTVSKCLLNKMDKKYQQLCGTNIEFLHVEPLSDKITDASFYGDLPRCGKRNSDFLRVETLKGLVKMMFDEDENKLATCGICHNTVYKDDANVLTMKCGHRHHFSAFSKCQGIETWFENRRNCPLCRHEQ